MLPLNDGYYLQRIQQATAFSSMPQDHVFTLLARSDGTVAMNIDGSGGAVNFDYIVPAELFISNSCFQELTSLSWTAVSDGVGLGVWLGRSPTACCCKYLMTKIRSNSISLLTFIQFRPMKTSVDWRGWTLS